MKARGIITLFFLAGSISGFCSEVVPVEAPKSECIDRIESVAVVDPKLDSDFFRSKEASYPFHIIEHEDGHLENTMGGKVSKEDAIRIEHTAKCLSSHQGEHLMSFCDAEMSGGGLLLQVSGGLPAYASFLTLEIDKDKKLKCAFFATYPMTVPGEKLSWKITKKAFRMTSDKIDAGTRLLGWLSVEFEETCVVDGKFTSHQHKIEGYVKPVIRKPTLDSNATDGKSATDRILPNGGFR